MEKLVKQQIKNAIDLQVLYKKPYMMVPFIISHTQIETAMNAFFDFLGLSDDLKNHIDMKIIPLHRRGEIGYTHRDPKDNIYNDSKDFFHYHPVIWERYSEFVENNAIIKHFLNCAHPIWEAVYHTVYEILSGFEKNYSGTLGKIFDTKEPCIILRFLKYEFSNSSLYLAQPHFDAGSFTLAIAESTAGLRIGTHPEDLEVIEHQKDKAIFMVSSNYRKIINADLLPAWHDVIQLDQTHIGRPYARWALVAFIEGHSVTALSRSETHKWYAAEK